MKRILVAWLLLAGLVAAHAAETTDVETRVAEAVKNPGVTVIHFWAPWCPNCKAELANQGWSTFLAANPDVKFVFVTIWRGTSEDSAAVLAKNGVGEQPNFQLLVHPNASRKKEDKVSQILGLPITWIPSTWVFKDGQLRFALNYGELHFPMLQQLIQDSSDKWSHKTVAAK